MDYGDGALVLDADAINPWFNADLEAGLTDLGQDQAAAVARHLLKHPVDAVYSSQLLRARQTAGATADRLGLGVTVTEDLAELRPGSLPADGLGYGYLRLLARLPWLSPERRMKLVGGGLIQLYFSAWLAGRTAGGEPRPAFEARLHRVLHRVRQAHAHRPDARVALFAHGYVIFYLSGWLTAPGRARAAVFLDPHVANGAITELELDPDPTAPPRLLGYAKSGHLP